MTNDPANRVEPVLEVRKEAIAIKKAKDRIPEGQGFLASPEPAGGTPPPSQQPTAQPESSNSGPTSD
jgi:hypothetical protein